MRATSALLIGFAGLGLTMTACAAWIAHPSQLSLSLILLIGVCAAGGLVPIQVPGLPVLPASLPLVGAMALTSGAPAAMAAGFSAGLCTSIARCGDAGSDGETRSGWMTGWAVGGLLAVAAGLAAGGASRLGLTALPASITSAPAPDEAMRSALALISILLVALLVGWRFRQVLRRAQAAERRARTGISLVEAIALAIEAKDRTSERHLRRMSTYALGVGRRLGMPSEELEALEYAALLHDIGKLVVPESILSKPGGLSSEEFQTMSAHAKVGAEILETTSLSSSVASMVRHHHERYDGSGYPEGLIGMEIPLGARILAVVDTFEALTSERPFRRGVEARKAVAYIERQAGTLFDPRVVRALVEHHREFEAQVLAEEKERAPRREATALKEGDGAGTRKAAPPYQAVLDRIASSHMEVYSLHEINQALGKTLNLEESFALIAAKMKRLIHFSSCAVYLLDAEEQRLRPRFATGSGASRIMEITIPVGQRVSGWAALQRRPCAGRPSARAGQGCRPDLEEIAEHQEIAALRSSAAAPLVVDETLVGVLTLYDLAEREYTATEERLLALIARQVAGAVRTGLLFEQTQEHALTDSLTGLPNARYMFIVFDQEAAKAREHGTPLTLMVMDIDNFREINDDFGHHAGDRFLVGMAKAIRSQMRLCDTCIRYAGDEFVAILPGLAGDEVGTVIERMTEATRDYCLEARPGRPVRLTLSIGFASMPADGDNFETLMALAGGRMKQHKSRRRDRGEAGSAHVPFGALARDGRH